MIPKTIAIIASVIVMAATFVAQKTPAIDKHAGYGVSCKDCHGTAAKTAPSTDKCLACHGGNYSALVRASPKQYDIKKGITNPHASHVGEVRCTRCHKNHAQSELYCNECHVPKINLTTP